jgi:hypothetical protein
MSGLVKLKLFHMGHIGVQTLPEDFGHLQNLVELHLYGCKNLETLPQSFGLLQLQRLEMYDNPELEMPPEGFGRPKKRKHDSLFIKLKSSSGRFKVIRTIVAISANKRLVYQQVPSKKIYHHCCWILLDAYEYIVPNN